MLFRRATLNDLDALVALERDFPSDRLSRRSFRHLLTRGQAEVWVCVEAGRIVGNAVALFRRRLRSARLYSLIVVPASRKRGTATELVERIEAAARRRGYERLSLEVRIGNRAALGLYEKLMYRIVRRLPRFYDDGSDAWRLERALVSGGARADSPSLTV